MAELNNVMRELLKGKNAETNFPAFYEEIKALYYRQASVQLAMEYDNFCEAGKNFNAENPVEDYITERIINGNNNDAQALLALRAEYIQKMETVTAFTDRFTKYEYILNRVEYRFKDSAYDMSYYSGDFENDIYNYIFSEKDNVVINTKISGLVSELPMRLSKNKFFDMIDNAYSIYKGSEKKSLDDFDFSLRVAGCIYPIDTDSDYSELTDMEKELASIDYSEIDEDTYNKARNICELASEKLENMITFYMDATAVLNKLIVLSVCKGTFYDVNEENAVKKAIELSRKAQTETISDEEFYDCFSVFEGVQETISRRLDGPDNAIPEIIDINRDAILAFKEDADMLLMISRLMSSSTFADINVSVIADELVDEAYAKNKTEAIVKDFAEYFETKDRNYRRAVMAAVCGMLPVFFNNTDEIKKYINVSLSQCNDEAEKKAVMEILSSLMYNNED